MNPVIFHLREFLPGLRRSFTLVFQTMLLSLMCSDATEYCDRENFEKNCSTNQIINIQSALYGRMTTGKCITGEGYTGCSSDVTRLLQGICSGKQTCKYSVNKIGKNVTPCSKRDFVLYLDATSECVNVAAGDRVACNTIGHTELNQDYGLISSNSYAKNYGVNRCPWLIRAKDGQKVELNITVYDPPGIQGTCPYLVQIEDNDKIISKSICVYGKSTSHLYTSRQNVISIYNIIRTSSVIENGAKLPTFVITYRLIGCPNIVEPNFSSVKRTGNDLTVRCDQTKETWFLTCKNNRWMGEMGNCTTARNKPDGGDNVMTSEIPFPQGLIVAVVLGLILGVIIGFTSLGIYIFVQRRRKQQQHASSMMHSHVFGYDIKDQYTDSTMQRETGPSSSYYTGTNLPPHQQYGSGVKSTILYESPVVPDTAALESGGIGGGGGVGISSTTPGVHRASSIHRPYMDRELPPIGPQSQQQFNPRREML